MKILTILALTLIIGSIISKETSSNLKKTENTNKNNVNKQVVVDRILDAPLHAAVTTDPFLMQHQAVKNKIKFLILGF